MFSLKNKHKIRRPNLFSLKNKHKIRRPNFMVAKKRTIQGRKNTNPILHRATTEPTNPPLKDLLTVNG